MCWVFGEYNFRCLHFFDAFPKWVAWSEIVDGEVNKFLCNQRMRYTFVGPFYLLNFIRNGLHCTAVICVIFSLLLVDFIALSGDSFLFIAHSRTFYRNFFFKMCSSVASDFRCATALSTKLRSNQKFKWIQCARDGPFFIMNIDLNNGRPWQRNFFHASFSMPDKKWSFFVRPFNVKMLPIEFIWFDCEFISALDAFTQKRLSFLNHFLISNSLIPSVCEFVMNESDTKCYSKTHNLLNVLFALNFTVDSPLTKSIFGIQLLLFRFTETVAQLTRNQV